MKFFIVILFCLSIYGCKDKVSPCACAENLRKINKGFDVEFDEACDKHMDGFI
jgi:hypothetical protein